MGDKWIIGTGFTRGIGHEIAKKASKEGFKIIHLGRKKIGFEDEYIWWDLLNPIVDNPVGKLKKVLFGKQIYGFIYAAGVMPFIEITDSNKKLFWQSQSEAMQVNYLACAQLIEEILPFLFSPYDNSEEKFAPFVAHLSSLSAVDPLPGLELYGATKAAALHYFTWMSKRFKPDVLTCLSIHPGTVDTDMIADILRRERIDLPIVTTFRHLVADEKMISPAQSAQNIYKFLFGANELKIDAHGKLFLADKFQIH